MPFVRQRLTALHCRIASKPLAVPQSDNMTSSVLAHEIVEKNSVEVQSAVSGSAVSGSSVSGFRSLLLRSSLLHRSKSSKCSPLAVVAMSAAFSMAQPGIAQAKSSKTSSSHKFGSGKSTSKSSSCLAWTSGSMTYLRSRPGIQTPPVAKVPRRTPVTVLGKFNGWYHVQTKDHKLGWVHNELVNSSALSKVKEMSHSQAREASDDADNQLMFGTVEELKKHYQRFGASGAKKGLAVLGVTVGSKSNASKQKIASQKASHQKITQAKLASQKITPTAQAKATQAKWASQKAAQAKLAQAKATQAKATQAKATQAKWAAAKAAQDAQDAQEKSAQAKATQAKIAHAKLAAAKATQAKAEAAKIAQAKIAAAAPTVATPPTATPAGTPLQPILPNPTTSAVTKVITPAIPILPKAPAKTARKSNVPPPNISAEDLMRARQDHLKRSSKANSDDKADKAQKQPDKTAFVPKVYYLASAVYAPSMSRDNAPAGQFTPRSEDAGPKALFMPLDRSLPLAKADAPKVVIAKNTAKAPAKPTVKTAAKPATKGASKPIISRGGSPRDLARVSKNDFGQGVATQALSYRGRPYIRGAASPSRGFDCSGLIYYLLRQRGLNPPRTAAGLASYGKPVPQGQLQPGDLVLFANTYKRGISHVGIYTGNNNFVHAANSGTGVRVSSLGETYYCRKYWGARRVEVKK